MSVWGGSTTQRLDRAVHADVMRGIERDGGDPNSLSSMTTLVLSELKRKIRGRCGGGPGWGWGVTGRADGMNRRDQPVASEKGGEGVIWPARGTGKHPLMT